MSENVEIAALRIRLKDAEDTLRAVCTLQVEIDGRPAPWETVKDWRIELANEYCERWNLLKDKR